VRNADSILKTAKTKGSVIPLDACFHALLRANPGTFQEVFQMADGTLTIEDVLMEAGLIPKWLEEGREEGREKVAKNLLGLGWSVEKTAEVSELDIEKVKSLHASM
jgi:hypothetical protein